MVRTRKFDRFKLGYLCAESIAGSDHLSQKQNGGYKGHGTMVVDVKSSKRDN